MNVESNWKVMPCNDMSKFNWNINYEYYYQEIEKLIEPFNQQIEWSNKMNDSLFELTVEKNHLSIIIKALSNYICSQYDGLDAEVVDVPKTMENIKIASDMQLVLKHHLGGVQHAPKQTAETTGLVWIRDVDVEDMFSQHNDENLQYTNEVLQQAWDNVKERHKDILQRMSNK